MKKTNLKSNSISVGIPTYEGGESLVLTLKSIYNQTYFRYIDKILVIVDGNKIDKVILKRIQNKKLKIIYLKTRKGQSARINDLFKKLNSEYIVLTNDDTLLDHKAIEVFIKTFAKTNADLIAGRAIALDTNNFFEKILNVGQEINEHISRNWSNGNNYLACNGRLIAISKSLYKKIKIPEKLWNNDAYIYIFAKLNNFKFTSSKKAIVYYKSPGILNEHIRQSNKFQRSLFENQKHFKSELSSFYKQPTASSFKAFINQSIKNPLETICYLVIFFCTRIYTELSKQNNKKHSPKGYWQTDRSTKLLYLYEK